MGAWTWDELRDGDRPDGPLALNAYLDMPDPQPTGVMALDQLLGGGMTRGITVLGGGPGAGKTATACHAAAMMCAMGRHVVYASYETGWDIVQLRCASAWSVSDQSVQQINWSSIATGEERRKMGIYDGLSRESLSRYTVGSAMDPITTTLTMWDEGPGKNLAVDVGGNSVADLCHACEDVERELGEPPVLVVDYIQIVPTDAKGEQGDTERVTEVMGTLREYAYGGRGRHVLALSSLRKLTPAELREGPDLGWFRGSAHVGYDAEQAVVLVTDREKVDGEWVTCRAVDGSTEGHMTVVKNRTGAAGWSRPTLLYGWCSYLR
jgi:replicative DNA helicase